MGVIIEKQCVSKRRNKSKPINKSAGFNSRFIHSRSKKTVKKDNRPGFTFNVPILPVLAVAASAFVIALALFNWENISLPDSIAFSPGLETEAEHHTMQYAAMGVTNLLPTAVVENTTENRAGNSVETPPEDPKNDLITFEWQQYRVRKGDAVSSIAQRFGVSVGAVIASNDIRNARTLREGQTLRIPNIDGIPHQVKSGDSLSKIAASYNVPLEVILDVNDIKSDNIRQGETLFIPGARMNDIDLRMSLGELFMYPVASKYVTSRYGMRKDPKSGVLAFHTGIDLRADTGTTVMAALDGTISVIGENWLYGKHIIITHDNGYKTLYAHLNSYSVRQGDRVARGRKIGESGNTGYSTGPHLHFSIYDKNNRLVNPLELLR
ncbi:MAG: M23 family metallopeptidase [Treponema sp.]|jgi:murein DD-endopeptidase MepM/ murein hydrolase activator NlpD|nr:M23 family metallopeptidase [Treponema sp.]